MSHCNFFNVHLRVLLQVHNNHLRDFSLFSAQSSLGNSAVKNIMVAQIETSTQLTEKRKNESGVEDYESLENVNYV